LLFGVKAGRFGVDNLSQNLASLQIFFVEWENIAWHIDNEAQNYCIIANGNN
jgi:hypothetical protein